MPILYYWFTLLLRFGLVKIELARFSSSAPANRLFSYAERTKSSLIPQPLAHSSKAVLIPGGSANIPINEFLKNPAIVDWFSWSGLFKRTRCYSAQSKAKAVFSKPAPVPKRPELGKASPMLEGFTVFLTSSPDLFCARIDAISDVHSSRLPALFSLREGA